MRLFRGMLTVRVGLVALVGCFIATCHGTSEPIRSGPDGSTASDLACSTTRAYPDLDGDGHAAKGAGIPVTYCGVRGDPPAGYTWNAIQLWDEGDCDDADPTVYRWLYRDQDGDGYGISDDVHCGVDHEVGYAAAGCGKDCDDHNPERHPNAVEIFGDGLDANCDGEDGAQCNPANLAPGTVLSSLDAGRCDQASDLAVADIVECLAGCSMQSYVVLVNRGGLPYQGPVVIRAFQGAGADVATRELLLTRSDLTLAPGQVSLPILVGALGGGDATMRIEPQASDCDPSNHEVAFYSIHVDCM
jgi:hypothetical protein